MIKAGMNSEKLKHQNSYCKNKCNTARETRRLETEGAPQRSVHQVTGFSFNSELPNSTDLTLLVLASPSGDTGYSGQMDISEVRPAVAHN